MIFFVCNHNNVCDNAVRRSVTTTACPFRVKAKALFFLCASVGINTGARVPHFLYGRTE